MRMAQCVHCSRTYSIGLANGFEPPTCPHCKEPIAGPRAEPGKPPTIRVVEPPPAPAPPSLPGWKAALKKAPWKIALGLAGAAMVLLLIRFLVVVTSGGYTEASHSLIAQPALHLVERAKPVS